MQRPLHYLKEQCVTVHTENDARLLPHRDSIFKILGRYSLHFFSQTPNQHSIFRA